MRESYLHWYRRGVEPGHLPLSVRLFGKLDIGALLHAFRATIRRHEALRTVFRLDASGHAHAVPLAAAPLVSYFDLSHYPSQERDAEAARVVERHFRLPFRLIGEPLVRACVVRLTSVDHVFVATMSHIISDGWSLGLLGRELAHRYDVLVGRTRFALPRSVPQVSDVEEWERSRRPGNDAYWKEQLRGASFRLPLSTDSPSTAAYVTKREARVLAVPGRHRLEGIARDANATPFMLFLASVAPVLARAADVRQVIIATPLLGRQMPGSRLTVGCLFKPAFVRIDLSHESTFTTLLAQVRRLVLEAIDHQEYTVRHWQDALLCVPWFYASLYPQMSSFPASAVRAEQFVFHWSQRMVIPDGYRDVFYRLHPQVGYATPDAFEIGFEFNGNVFSKHRITRLIDSWAAVLAAVSTVPDVRIADLPTGRALSEGSDGASQR